MTDWGLPKSAARSVCSKIKELEPLPLFFYQKNLSIFFPKKYFPEKKSIRIFWWVTLTAKMLCITYNMRELSKFTNEITVSSNYFKKHFLMSFYRSTPYETLLDLKKNKDQKKYKIIGKKHSLNFHLPLDWSKKKKKYVLPYSLRKHLCWLYAVRLKNWLNSRVPCIPSNLWFPQVN